MNRGSVMLIAVTPVGAKRRIEFVSRFADNFDVIARMTVILPLLAFPWTITRCGTFSVIIIEMSSCVLFQLKASCHVSSSLSRVFDSSMERGEELADDNNVRYLGDPHQRKVLETFWSLPLFRAAFYTILCFGSWTLPRVCKEICFAGVHGYRCRVCQSNCITWTLLLLAPRLPSDISSCLL